MNISAFFLSTFLSRHKGDPLAALQEACDRLEYLHRGVSFGYLRTPPYEAPRPGKPPPREPIDIGEPDGD